MLIGMGPKSLTTGPARVATGLAAAQPPAAANDHAPPPLPPAAASRASEGPTALAAAKIGPDNTAGPLGGNDAGVGRPARVEASAPLERYRKRGEIGQD